MGTLELFGQAIELLQRSVVIVLLPSITRVVVFGPGKRASNPLGKPRRLAGGYGAVLARGVALH